MIADLGLSKQLTAEDTSNSAVYGISEYMEPQCYKHDIYVRDEKSDIYSLGVLFWEITSGYSPFSKNRSHNLTIKISNGFREEPINNTPQVYVTLYQKCWNDDPNLRPDIEEVYFILEEEFNKLNTNVNENIPKIESIKIDKLDIPNNGDSKLFDLSISENFCDSKLSLFVLIYIKW